ncbi:MAG: hypothetical protein ACTSWK_14325 [Promethearchaeota archaeon]
MSCITPIFASLNQNENDREEESFQRKKKTSIMITILGSMFFLGFVYYSGGFGYFSFPTIYIVIIIIISLVRVISTASRSRSRGRSQNYPQRQRMEPSPLEHKPTMIKRNKKYCLQCGSKVDRDIDSLSIYFCSYCGYEIKNNRV